MNALKMTALAGALALALGTGAMAQTGGAAGAGTGGTTGAGTAGTAGTGTTGAGAATAGGTSPSGGAQGPGSNANIPEQCRELVGRALGDCLKLHGAMERGAMGTDHSTRSMSSNRMKSRSDTGTARGNGGGNAPTGDVGGAAPTK